MGFMAGFGEGFSKSFGQAQDRKAQRESEERGYQHDLFKMNYQNYLKNRDEYTEKSKLSAENAKKAQSIAQYAKGKNKMGAMQEAYDLLQSGENWKTVQEHISAKVYDGDGGSGVFKPMAPEAPAEPKYEDFVQPRAKNNPLYSAMGIEGYDGQQPQQATQAAPEAQPDFLGQPTAPAAPAPVQPSVTVSEPNQDTLRIETDVPQPSAAGNDQTLQDDGLSPNDKMSAEDVAGGQAFAQAKTEEEVQYDEYGGRMSPAANAPDFSDMNSVTKIQSQLAYARATNDEAGVKLYSDMLETHIATESAIERAKDGYTTVLVTGPSGAKRPVNVKPDYDAETGTTRWVSSDGSVIPQGNAQELTPKQQERVDQAIEYSQKPEVIKAKSDVANAAAALSTAGQVFDIVEKGRVAGTDVSTVLSKPVSNLADLAQTFDKSVIAGLGVLGDSVQPKTREELAAQEAKIDSLLGQGVEDAASLNALFRAKMNVMVYRAGMAEGMEGRSFTDADAKRIEQVIDSSSTISDFKYNMASYLKGNIEKANAASDALMQYNTTLNVLDKELGWKPVESYAPTVEEFIGGMRENQSATRGLELVNEWATRGPSQGQMPTQTPAGNEKPPVRMDPAVPRMTEEEFNNSNVPFAYIPNGKGGWFKVERE